MRNLAKRLLTTMLSVGLTMLVPAGDWPVLKVYEGDSLRRVKMPLGGVGTGTISLAGRGALVDWNVRWNDIPKVEQDAYIRRAECIMRQ